MERKERGGTEGERKFVGYGKGRAE